MNSRLLMTLQVAVIGAQKIGAVPLGTRVIAPVGNGRFEGPRLRGKVLPGGGDEVPVDAPRRDVLKPTDRFT